MYRYVCGKWSKSHAVDPPENWFHTNQEMKFRQIISYLDDTSISSKKPEAINKANTFYQTCLLKSKELLHHSQIKIISLI